MQLIKYLPEFLQEIREFKELFAAEDIELEKLQKAVDSIEKEVIVNTAESYGLDRYEKIYNIKKTSDDVDVRRFNILSKINNRVPFTLKWLDNKFKQLAGEGNYIINVDYANYKITISIAYLFGDIADTLKKELRSLLPANMIIQINLFSNAKAYVGAIVHEKIRTKLEVVR